MTKEKVLEYSKKYKKIQKRIAIIVTISILIIGIAALAGGICFCILDINKYTKVIGIILIVVALLDIFLGIKFIRFTLNNLKYMSSKEAAERYYKITGKE